MRDFRFLTLVISFFAASVFCAPFSWGGDPNTVENQGACDTADLCWDLVRDTTNDTGPSILIETNRSDEISFLRIYVQRVRVLTHPDSSWGHDEVRMVVDVSSGATTDLQTTGQTVFQSNTGNFALATETSQRDSDAVPQNVSVTAVPAEASRQNAAVSFLSWKPGAKPLDSRKVTERSKKALGETRAKLKGPSSSKPPVEIAANATVPSANVAHAGGTLQNPTILQNEAPLNRLGKRATYMSLE